MNTTKIEWTDSTWNPATGCSKVSDGCAHCYAEKLARRLQAMRVKKYESGFKLALHPGTLNEPSTWKKPRMVFVNSMSDMFHEDIPLDYIKQVFQVMNDNPQHTFQVLTKRAKILNENARFLNWTKNIWMGVTVESEKHIDRIALLADTPAEVKFLSCEPLLTGLPTLPLEAIDWVIVGGESGPGARPIRKEWVDDIRIQCETASIPFFFKQWGGVNKKASGRELDGMIYSEMPRALVLT